MTAIRFLVAFLATVGFFSPAFSQEILDYVESGPPASWVVVNDVPRSPFELGDNTNAQHLLVDKQLRVSQSDTTIYRHYATELPSADAVEANSTITINFDPAFSRVEVHTVQLRRGETIIDLLDLADFDIFREETDREKLIYNGRLQLAYIVPGVRVGDILEYSYTVSGRNPALGPHFFGRFQHQYPVPVQKLYQRYSLPEDIGFSVKAFNTPPNPTIDSGDGYVSYTWSQTEVAGRELEDNLPFGSDDFPITEISSFNNWDEVGAYLHRYYDAAEFQTEEVLELAAAIRNSTADQAKQLRAALDFVEKEVRYLGVELGSGGYIPRAPDLVLERRFGDCKDMVLLLISILKALKIEAYPLLVDFDYRERVADRIPSIAAFDHVVVMAELDGKTYFLDPTRGPQLGDLDHLQQADFGNGVVIAANGPGMIPIVPNRPIWQKETTDRYDLTDPDIAKFSTTTVFLMAHADSMLTRRERNGLKEIDDTYFEFYQSSYPTIERDEPLHLEIDEDAGKVTLTASYLIHDYWQLDEDTGEETFEFYVDEIASATPPLDRSSRNGPYQLAYPTSIRQKLVLITNQDFGYQNSTDTKSAPGLTFENSISTSGGKYERTLSYRITDSQIAAEELADHMTLIKAIDEEVWRSYTRPSTAIWDTHAEELFVAYFVFANLASLVVVFLHRNRDADDRKHQVLYPVGTLKFMVLSTITVGSYQVYWAYKNWLWIRDVKGEAVSPFLRAFFIGFTNFSLFPRIAKEMPRASAGLAAMAPILAVLYLLSTISDRFDGSTPQGEMIAGWIGFAGILIMVPMSQEVLRKNASNSQYVLQNSRFGWPAIGLILLFLPVFVLYVIGLSTY